MAFNTQKNNLHRMLFGLMLLFTCGVTFAQQHDFLFHPSFRDEYLTTQVLPDDRIRVFFIADQNNGWTFREVQYVDFFQDSIFPSSPPVTISVPDGFINYFVQDAFVLRLADGSSIIADNFFDCDYGHAGSIYKLNASGLIEWWYDLLDDFGVDGLAGLGFVDEHIIGIDAWSSLFRLTTQGIPIFESESNRVPDHSMQTSFGYLLSYSDSFEIRNASFDLVQRYLLNGNVIAIETIDSVSYRIRTSQEYYELDAEMQLTSLPFGIHTVWSSPTTYWQYADDLHAVIAHDTFFTPIDTIPLSPGVKPVTGGIIQDQVLTLCSYTTDVNRGLVAFGNSGDEVRFDLLRDLGITDIEFPDTVLAEFYNSTVPWSGWSYTYEWVEAQVTNFGETPVSRFYIQGHDLLDCFWWCYVPVPFWQIDSLLLLPGEQAWVRLPGFTTRCDWQSFDPSLCLSTVAPDERADGLYLNDAWCESFEFILQDEPPIRIEEVTVYPNPASEEVTVMTDLSTYDRTTIHVLNASGMVVESIRIETQNTTISLADLTAGIYFIKTTDQRGWSTITKLAVIR